MQKGLMACTLGMEMMCEPMTVSFGCTDDLRAVEKT